MHSLSFIIENKASFVKAAGDKLLMNNIYKAKFWWRSYAKKRYILNVWEPIPLKLNRELGQWWKCSSQSYDFVKRDFVSKFSLRGEDNTS